MKKVLLFAFATLIAVSTFVGCSKSPDKVLPRRDGVWSYSASTTYGSISNKETGKITFTKTTYTSTADGNSSTESGTWVYDSSGKTITITSSKGGVPVKFVVSNATRSKETWTYSQAGYSWEMNLTKD